MIRLFVMKIEENEKLYISYDIYKYFFIFGFFKLKDTLRNSAIK